MPCIVDDVARYMIEDHLHGTVCIAVLIDFAPIALFIFYPFFQSQDHASTLHMILVGSYG